MGFNDNNEQVVMAHAKANKNQNWSHVVENSKKVVTFLDLCGHEKYLKTTMFGLQGLMPDYAMILIGANMGLNKMTKEHLGIVLAMRIPFFIVITKIDIAPEQVYEKTKATLQKILKSPQARKDPILIEGEDADVDAIAKDMYRNDRGKNVMCPIFSVSNVTGEGLTKLKEFISLL